MLESTRWSQTEPAAFLPCCFFHCIFRIFVEFRQRRHRHDKLSPFVDKTILSDWTTSWTERLEMDVDDDECYCNWHCSCKVLLKNRSLSYYTAYQEHLRLQEEEEREAEKSREQKGVEPVGSGRNEAVVSVSQNKNGNGAKGIKRPRVSKVNGVKSQTHAQGGHRDKTEHKSTDDKQQNGNLENGAEPEPSLNRSTGVYNCRNRSRFHKCKVCGKMFGQLSSLQWHEKEHTLEAPKQFQCEDCGKQYSSLVHYEKHLKVHPKCLLCGKSLTTREAGSQSQLDEDLNVTLCRKCKTIEAEVHAQFQPQVVQRNLSFAEEESREINMNTSLSNGVSRRPSAPGIRSQVNGNAGKKTAMKAANGVGVADKADSIFFCDFCGAMFDCLEDFQPHYDRHGTSEYECRYCMLSLPNAEKVTNHERSEHEELPFVCLFCPIKFKYCSQREFHEAMHSDPQRVDCKLCQQPFLASDRLEMHMQNIHHTRASSPC